MKIDVNTDNIKFFEALSSVTRIRIIEMLSNEPKNVKEIAEVLNMSSAIVTRHIQQLEEAGIVKCRNSSGIRGIQKICSLDMDQAVLFFQQKEKQESAIRHSIPVGQYHAYNITPTCGLSSDSKIIGYLDDPRYFADPEHIKANIIWFGSGWVEYRIPNYMLGNQEVQYIEISLEICSEAPGYNENWPSDISFSLNGIEVGMWTSPGDFGASRGVFTPDWWNHETQHGLLKTLLVNTAGSYMDGVNISKVKVEDLGISYGQDIVLRIANPSTARNVGGITLFGMNFGNYNQDINVKIDYKNKEKM